MVYSITMQPPTELSIPLHSWQKSLSEKVVPTKILTTKLWPIRELRAKSLMTTDTKIITIPCTEIFCLQLLEDYIQLVRWVWQPSQRWQCISTILILRCCSPESAFVMKYTYWLFPTSGTRFGWGTLTEKVMWRKKQGIPAFAMESQLWRDSVLCVYICVAIMQ